MVAVFKAHTAHCQKFVFLRLQPLKMVAPLLAPAVAKTFQGPLESQEGKGSLLPEPQRLLARALGAANVQEVQVWPQPARHTSKSAEANCHNFSCVATSTATVSQISCLHLFSELTVTGNQCTLVLHLAMLFVAPGCSNLAHPVRGGLQAAG